MSSQQPQRNQILESEAGNRSGRDVEKSIGTDAWLRLCRRLRHLRERAGLTQAELARRIGERQGFVSAYETGQRRLDIIELQRICEAIGPTAAPVVKLLEALEAVMATFDTAP
jgi:ribosome-binding protein aMBF1 (putative translation factor)